MQQIEDTQADLEDAVVRTICVAVILVIQQIGYVTPAVSQALLAKMTGVFEKNGSYWQHVKISRVSFGNGLKAKFDVATRGCQGDVEMNSVAISKTSILFSKTDDAAESGVCKIGVIYSSSFDSITVTHKYCGFSGAACDFNGQMKRSR